MSTSICSVGGNRLKRLIYSLHLVSPLLRFQPDKLRAVGRVHRNVTDLDSLESAERDIDTGTAQCPNLAVKISESIHGLPLDGKNDVAGLEACLFSGTS